MPLYEITLEGHKSARHEAPSEAQAWKSYRDSMGIVRTRAAILIKVPGDGRPKSYRAGDLESQLQKELEREAREEKQDKAAAKHKARRVEVGKQAQPAETQGAKPAGLTEEAAKAHLGEIKGASVLQLREILKGLAESQGAPIPDLRQKKAALLAHAYALLVHGLGGNPTGSLEGNAEALADLLE